MQFDWATGSIQLGVKSLRLHKLRSLLTVLGVVFGAGSVIVMLAIGEGIRYEAVQKIKDLGANNIIIRSVKPEGGTSDAEASGAVRYGLTRQDLQRMVDSIPTLRGITAIRDHRRPLTHADHRLQGRVVGVTPSYQEATGMRLRSGRFISELDNQRVSAVAVLGAQVANSLFPLVDPIGKTIRIGEDQYYHVVGVAESRGSTSNQNNGLPAEDLNLDVYIPFETDQQRFGETVAFDRGSGQLPEKVEIRQITLTLYDTSYVKRTAEIVTEILRNEHQNGDTIMIVPLDLLEKAEQTQRIFTLVLSAIASISLLIGGIGIMNIMLATVTERTKEIGLRRALGARRQDIVTQFLIETLVLTSVGGALGVLLGLLLSWQVTQWSGIATMIRIWSPLLAFATSVFVGIVFGIYPARRAAMMDPIEALRHE